MIQQLLTKLRRLWGKQPAAARRTSAQPREKRVDKEKTAVDPIFLRQQMSNHLSEAELGDLAQLVGLDYEQLSGGKGRRVLQIVTHCEQNNRIPQLLAHCQQLKTAVSWQLDA